MPVQWARRLFVCLAIAVIFKQELRADIGLLLHEPVGSPWRFSKETPSGFWAQSGHAAILISDLCAETPTQLRACRQDETPGVVVSRYNNVSPEEYDWLAVPYNWYFYGVESLEQAPLFGNETIDSRLAHAFYEQFLSLRVNRVKRDELPPGGWRDLLGSSMRRDVYSFDIVSPPQLRAEIFQEGSGVENRSRFNIFLRNCADFAADFFKERFEKFDRNNIADMGLTSPKGVAQAVAALGKSSFPVYRYRVQKFDQLPGSYPRSRPNLFPLENAIRNPKYAAPLIYFRPALEAGFAVFYGLLFRFNPEHEFRNRFSRVTSALQSLSEDQSRRYDELSLKIAAAQSRSDTRLQLNLLHQRASLLAEVKDTSMRIRREQELYFGTKAEWDELRRAVRSLRETFHVGKDWFEKARTADYEWRQGSLFMTLPLEEEGERSAIVAGRSAGTGDADLLLRIRVARLASFVEAGDPPPIHVARAEMEKIEELLASSR